jgi:hypothetical protein
MPIRALQHAFRAIRLALYALEAPNNFHGGRRTTSLSHSLQWAANSNADIWVFPTNKKTSIMEGYSGLKPPLGVPKSFFERR